jgi:hypothetical protein
MGATNPYCEALGIELPRLEAARKSPEANTYSLLIVALLERGEPITLEEAARRFEEAGVAPADRALASLKRCKPGRPPIYRDGDRYALDPHAHETDLWAFRLGLRPPRTPRLELARPAPAPLPSPDEPLTVEALDEAWSHGVPSTWSALRIAICALDAHGASMRAPDLLAIVDARSRLGRVVAGAAAHWRRGAPIRIREGGLWELDRSHAAVRPAREAAIGRIEIARRWAEQAPDPALIEANRRSAERRRRASADRLAGLRRVLLHAFPAGDPAALVLLDVERREIATLVGADLGAAAERLARYDVIAAVGVRPLLRSLRFEPGGRRLAELGPPQKTMQIDRRGRTLRITTRLLVQGSCGIARPLADEETLRALLRGGAAAKLRRRLEADAKSLFALYQYGRLHGALRVRWGFLDARIPAPWVHPDEPRLYDLMQEARELRAPLEVVTGSAPGWADSWSRARRAFVVEEGAPWPRLVLIDGSGFAIDRADVQLARLADPDRRAH